MAPKPTVYVETTVLSYLAARPSQNALRAAHQQLTRDWWDKDRAAYELFISALVLAECAAGDPTAAEERLAFANTLPLLAESAEAETLAEALIRELAIPPQETRDAAHVAVAATNGIEYLLTWNCRHLANLHQRGRIEQVCRDYGYQPPLIGTPIELRHEDQP